jgi:hypothetical protein
MHDLYLQEGIASTATPPLISGIAFELLIMSDIPSTMNAWVFRQLGQPKDVLKLEKDYPVPVAKDKQVIVKVHAISLNREFDEIRVFLSLTRGVQLSDTKH